MRKPALMPKSALAPCIMLAWGWQPCLPILNICPSMSWRSSSLALIWQGLRPRLNSSKHCLLMSWPPAYCVVKVFGWYSNLQVKVCMILEFSVIQNQGVEARDLFKLYHIHRISPECDQLIIAEL
mmetsp:Transcript_8057/g.15277  ORF Transcript_8057/g.15277 Transcript_8057/m.15277 type:complete len:125 (-) Transcript_8057:709-1083(-)